ncbi:twin-arginine translocase subunit TatC [Halodesulfovibrio sp.]|jgi:sec-independent protein translocase protein TatC|uniref:twin-arginine translocase subunit TatC n=1 Tax=Halodesulfovibrio sp. TaxID=1912772 RepID=UPI0025D24143|nr:twin-arginine translocase subunit TatC [Halodesulfovibrio sp.]MCT4625924.1 twin-arginine translocase subunit TatC [Halodesulfovibrio sp.]
MSVDKKTDAQPSEADETASDKEHTEELESSNDTEEYETVHDNGSDDSDPSAEIDFSDGPRPDRIEDHDDDNIDDTESGAPSAPDGGDSDDNSAPATLTDRINEMEEEEDDDEEEEESMTLLQHLDELRLRLKRISFAVIIGCLACYSFAEKLFDYLVMPMVAVMPDQSSFIYTAPHEAFVTYLKVAALAGFFAASPYIFYQIWAFIAPGLYEEERKYIVPIAFFSAACFIGGGAFAYFIVFPFAFEFFMSFNTGNIQAMLKLNEYLSFSMKLIFAFGLVFEMPLFALFLSRLGIVTATMMRKARKFAILFSFILAALLTPPDVVSQLLMAGPLMILYEISIIIAALFGRRRPSEEISEEDETDEEEKEPVAE